MRIRWTVPAAEDLEDIKSYLEQQYPQYAESTIRAIYLRIRSLKRSPHKGRPGYRAGTREIAHTPLPYIVIYALSENALWILHIHHGATDWQ